MKQNRVTNIQQAQMNLYQLHSPNFLPPITKTSQSLERENQIRDFSMQKQSFSNQSPNIQRLSFQESKFNNICVGEVSESERQQIIQYYYNMIIQESDLFVLYNSFKQYSDSLNQIHQFNQLTSHLDWWKERATSQWSGVKNLSIQNKKKDGSFLESRVPTKISPESLQTNASSVINRLKREVDQMSERINQDVRVVNNNKQPSFRHITFKVFEQSITKQMRQLLCIYQIQNKIYKSHLGFCVIKKKPHQNCKIQKFFIGKHHRKENYLNDILGSLLEYLFCGKVSKVSMKVNSGQHELIKIVNSYGAKLISEQALVGDLKVFTFQFQKPGQMTPLKKQLLGIYGNKNN